MKNTESTNGQQELDQKFYNSLKNKPKVNYIHMNRGGEFSDNLIEETKKRILSVILGNQQGFQNFLQVETSGVLVVE